MSQKVKPEKSGSQKLGPKSEHDVKVEKTKSKSKVKPCCVALLCDPTQEAMEYSKKKAHQRSSVPDQPTYEPWVRLYQRHRKAVEEANPVVNCLDPIVARDNYCQLKRYNIRGDAFQKLERDNIVLARRIARVFVDGSCVDDRHDPNIPSIKNMDKRLEKTREHKSQRLIQDNIKIHEHIKNIKSTISRKSQLEWYAKMEKYMEQRSLYPLHFKPQPCPIAYQKMVAKNAQQPKQYAYLQVELEDSVACNVICELYANLCPFTARNFQKLCQFRKGDCECTTYRCKTIDKLVSIPRRDGEYERAYWQVGGAVDAMPELVQHMVKEDTKIKHTKEGHLTKPKGVGTGEFYITAGPAPYLDGLCFVFGKVLGPGMPFLKKMAQTNIDNQGNTKTVIHITDCGVAASPDLVPRSMLMRDFIFRAHDDAIPLLDKHSDEYEDDE